MTVRVPPSAFNLTSFGFMLQGVLRRSTVALRARSSGTSPPQALRPFAALGLQARVLLRRSTIALRARSEGGPISSPLQTRLPVQHDRDWRRWRRHAIALGRRTAGPSTSPRAETRGTHRPNQTTARTPGPTRWPATVSYSDLRVPSRASRRRHLCCRAGSTREAFPSLANETLTSDEVLVRLEKIRPGFQAWATSIEAPIR